MIIEVIKETLIDALRILPFLFLTYVAMEYLEHQTEDKTAALVKKSGRLGPVVGALCGVFPQCGFSTAASNLYAGRVITLGTLFSIYLSTSDEMLPILISEKEPLSFILKVIGSKILIGLFYGLLIDIVYSKKNSPSGIQIEELCEHENCSCNAKNQKNSILYSASKHTIHIMLFLIIITFALNLIIEIVGPDNLSHFLLNKPVLGEITAGLIGLIPNCAASLMLTQLYLRGLMAIGSMMAGLLVGSGVGLLVLFRVNPSLKENLIITGVLYVIGVFTGILINLFL